MSHALTEVSAFDATVVVPDGGDNRTAASVVTPMQALADRTRYLLDTTLPLAGGTMTGPLLINGALGLAYDGPQTLIRVQSTQSARFDSLWVFDLNYIRLIQHDVTSAGTVVLELNNQVSGAVLTAVSVVLAGKHVSGAAGHGASKPATMPTIQLIRRDQTGFTHIGTTTTDDSVSAAAYDSAHNLTISGFTETILETSEYAIYCTGEAGANAVIDTTGILGVTASFTTTYIVPGG